MIYSNLKQNWLCSLRDVKQRKANFINQDELLNTIKNLKHVTITEKCQVLEMNHEVLKNVNNKYKAKINTFQFMKHHKTLQLQKRDIRRIEKRIKLNALRTFKSYINTHSLIDLKLDLSIISVDKVHDNTRLVHGHLAQRISNNLKPRDTDELEDEE